MRYLSFIYATESWYYNTRLRIIINHEKEENLIEVWREFKKFTKSKKIIAGELSGKNEGFKTKC